MNLTCVVGRCTSSDDKVKRHYWGILSAGAVQAEDHHAYIDLCSFHATMFKTKNVTLKIEGWDSIDEEPEGSV